MNQIVIKKNESLAKPEDAVHRITPFRVTDLPDRTLYEFVRLPESSKKAARHEIAVNNATARSILHDSRIIKNCAYIAVMKLEATFQVAFFPDDESPQIINKLPISELAKAVEELKAAGF